MQIIIKDGVDRILHHTISSKYRNLARLVNCFFAQKTNLIVSTLLRAWRYIIQPVLVCKQKLCLHTTNKPWALLIIIYSHHKRVQNRDILTNETNCHSASSLMSISLPQFPKLNQACKYQRLSPFCPLNKWNSLKALQYSQIILVHSG